MIRKVCFFGPKKKRFMQTESVLQTKNRSGPAKNRFSVALVWTHHNMVKPACINFRIITANFSGIRTVQILMVICGKSDLLV